MTDNKDNHHKATTGQQSPGHGQVKRCFTMPLQVGPCKYPLSMRVYLADLLQKLCSIYKAISLWDKKSSSGWHDDYGVNAWTAAEKQVFDEWLKTPEVSLYDKHNNMMHAD